MKVKRSEAASQQSLPCSLRRPDPQSALSRFERIRKQTPNPRPQPSATSCLHTTNVLHKTTVRKQDIAFSHGRAHKLPKSSDLLRSRTQHLSNTSRLRTSTATMGRMTRAKAAEVAERMHIDEDAVLELPSEEKDAAVNPATPEPDRAVLGEIAPNSAESKGAGEFGGRITRAKKNKKKSGKKETAIEEQSEVVEDEKMEGDEEGHDDAEAVDQAADEELEADTNEAMEKLAKLRITSLGNQAAAQAVQEAEATKEDNLPLLEAEENMAPEQNGAELADETPIPDTVETTTADEAKDGLPSISIDTQSQQQEPESSVMEEKTGLEAPTSPVASAMPNVIKNLRQDSPSKRSTSNKENVEPVEPVESPASGPSASPAVTANAQPAPPTQETSTSAASPSPATTTSARRGSSEKAEDPIEALDELEDAVEKVNLEIPQLPASPNSKKTDKPADTKEKAKKAKPAPVVRLTKATQARLSMAQGGNKDAAVKPATNRPRPSTTLDRASSVRQSVVPSTGRRITSNTSNANPSKPEAKHKKETVIPHSKPRPVSLSFPTPPPAARSTKAPTKSTFQLPGEAVAAKLKAAREERLKREAAAASSKPATEKKDAAADKKPAFKARPAPNMAKQVPSVRQTAASRARESIMNPSSTTAPKTTGTGTSSSHKRSNTVATTRPRPSTTPAPPQLTVPKRPRPSSMQIPSSSGGAQRNPSAGSGSGTAKGKEVYARAAAAKNAAEAEKREKEDAARKARAAAAERGRQASREWAEKQRAKKAAAAAVAAAGKETVAA